MFRRVMGCIILSRGGGGLQFAIPAGHRKYNPGIGIVWRATASVQRAKA